MSSVLQDVRVGLRGLRKSPTLTAVAVLTVALGIGVNTAMFTIVSAVLLRPLPFPNSQQLVALRADLPGLGLTDVGFSVPELDDLADRSGLFEMLSAVWVIDANLTGAEKPERVLLAAVSPNYFELLGGTPQIGRVLGAQDNARGFAEGVVLSDAAWHRLFGGDPRVLGRQLRLDTDLYTVVGVMPPGFRHPAAAAVGDVDVWAAAGFRANPFPSQPSRRNKMLPAAIARVKPSLTVPQAEAALQAFAESLRRDFSNDYPPDARWSLHIEPLHDLVVGNVHPVLLVLSGAVALILLIGCANVANLLLARASTRQQEIAIRLAVGAGRGRLVRQLLTENLVLAGIGGAIGLVVATWALPALLTLIPSRLPRIHEIGIDATVVMFGVAMTVLTSILFGVAPALQASRTTPLTAMRESGRGTTASGRQRHLRSALVVAEIALALVLMTGAGLLLTTVARLLTVNPGFDGRGVIAARTWIAVPNNPDLDRYRTQPARNVLSREILRRVAALPDVTDAAITTALPLSRMAPRLPVQIDGRPNEAEVLTAEVIGVTPQYFSIARIPLRRGRAFTDTDDVKGQLVAILDEAAAARFFPGEDALGRRIQLGSRRPQGGPPVMTIVGIVGNTKYDALDEPESPHVYASAYQRSGRGLAIVVKTRNDPSLLTTPLYRALGSTDAELPVFGVQPLEDTIAASAAERRFSATAVTVFAIVALVLAAGGVYGVMAYAVAQRTHEIGVRMAMGASPRQVLTSILRDGGRSAVLGVAIGVTLSVAATRLIQSLLFEVSATDPRILAASSALLVAAALIASYIPARRASRVDPLVSLRN